MDIKIYYLMEGVKQAKGIVVIIDVFRAATNIALLLSKGAERIIPIGSIEDTLILKEQHPDWTFTGEENGTQIPGLNYGNSPSIIDTGNYQGITIGMRTSSGTQGIIKAINANQILVGTFANSPALEDYIIKEAALHLKQYGVEPQISLVAMGWKGETTAPEDDKYAEYLRAQLQGKRPSFEQAKEEIMKKAPTAKRFLDPKDEDFPKKDLEYCLHVGRYNVVPKAYSSQTPGLIIELRDALKNPLQDAYAPQLNDNIAQK